MLPQEEKPLTRCDEVRLAQAHAIQRLWLLRERMVKRLDSGDQITMDDLDQMETHTTALADALKRCR